MRIRHAGEATPDLAQRIREVERQAGEAAAAAAQRQVEEEARAAASIIRVPQPRRARAFLFHGAAGERSFAQVTLLGQSNDRRA